MASFEEAPDYRRENEQLRTENEHLRRRNRQLESDLEYWNAGPFHASRTREHFHRPDCKWADFLHDSPNLIEFSSHEEAVAAGYKPCKTCRS
jgi:methylphosphotriester-DNA--protein-cysteine methyltransferase